MRQKLDYIQMHLCLFCESFLWTLTDLVRARRMRISKRLHDRYKPAKATDQAEADIKN